MFRRSAVAAVISLGLMELVRSSLWLAFIPLAAEGKGLGAALVGLGLSIHYGTETALKLFSGWLVDRHGARRLLPLSLALAIGATALLAFGHTSAPAMLTGAILLGLCTAPAWLAVIQAVAPPGEASGGTMGAIWLAWLMGMGGGPILTGVAMEYLPDHWIASLLVAVMGLACIAVLLYPPAALATSPATATRPLISLRSQWREMAPLAPALVSQTLLAGMMAPVIPRLAQETAGLSPAQYSLLISLAGAACLLGMLPGGWLVDRIGGRRILVGGFTAIGGLLGLLTLLLTLGVRLPQGTSTRGIGSALAVGMSADAGGLNSVASGGLASFMSLLGPICLAVAGGLLYALLLPAWTSTVGRAVPRDAVGTGWGLISTLEGGGLALGPVIGGALWSAAPTAMLTAIAVTLVLLGLYYRNAPLPGDQTVRSTT